MVGSYGGRLLISEVLLHHHSHPAAVSFLIHASATPRISPIEEPARVSLQKAPVMDPFSDDLTRAKSAKELKEHLETRVL